MWLCSASPYRYTRNFMDDSDWLADLLRELQLERFYELLTRELQLTRPEHFDDAYLEDADLLRIGLSKPAIRRLREAVKRQRNREKKDKFISKFRNIKKNDSIRLKDEEAAEVVSGRVAAASITCLINKSALTVYETIGRGSFAVVRRAVWDRGAGKKVCRQIFCSNFFSCSSAQLAVS